MSSARTRRGSGAAIRPRKGGARVKVPRKIVSKLPVEQDSANRLARLAFGLFALAIAGVAAAAVDLPGRAWSAFGEQMGSAGFRVRSVDVVGVKHMDSKPVFKIALDQQSTAMPLVDVEGIDDGVHIAAFAAAPRAVDEQLEIGLIGHPAHLDRAPARG